MVNILFNSYFAKHSKFNYDFVGNALCKDRWIQLMHQYEKYLDKNLLEREEFIVPKKIHQIWLGNKKLPKKYWKWMESWKKYNTDWEYKLWDEESIKKLDINQPEIYSKKINPGYRSDIIRYIILKKFGGLYVDTDFECLRPIPEKLRTYKFVSCVIFNNKPIIANGMIMSCPNHILLKNILKNINLKDYKNDINKIMINSGPEKLTTEYFSLINNIEQECLILPSNYFYPYPNFMLNTKSNRYEYVDKVTIGIHHWEMSWMKGSIISRIKRKSNKYFNLLFKNIKGTLNEKKI